MEKKNESSEGQKEEKSCQWSKYVCLKRRTESLLDLVEKKGARRPGLVVQDHKNPELFGGGKREATVVYSQKFFIGIT